MRILYVPFFSNVNYGGCSIFNAMKVLLMRMVRERDDVFIHWPVPGEPFHQTGLDYIKHPRVETFTIPALRYQENDAVFVPSDLFHRFNAHHGDVPIDLVLCDKPRTAFWVKMLMNQHLRHQETEIPVVAFSQYALCRGSVQSSSEDFELAQCLGWFSAEKTVWPSLRDYRIGIEACRKYLRPSSVQRIVERSIMDVGNSIDTDRIDALVKPKSRTNVRVNYGSRMATGYSPIEVFEEIEKVYQGGRDIKLVITSPSKPATYSTTLKAELKKRGVPFDFNVPCTQEKFYEEASQCHVALRMEQGYESSLSLREHLYMRVALVLPHIDNSEPILDGYPYMYRTKAEARTMLRYLIDHYWDADVQEVLDTYQARVLDIASSKKNGIRLYDHLVKVADSVIPAQSSIAQTMDLCNDAVTRSGKSSFTWDEFCDMCKKHTDAGIDPAKHLYFGRTNITFVHSLKRLGYVDDCQTGVPTYRKLGKLEPA